MLIKKLKEKRVEQNMKKKQRRKEKGKSECFKFDSQIDKESQ